MRIIDNASVFPIKLVAEFSTVEREAPVKSCQIFHLGMIDYERGLKLQEKLLEKRRSGAISDTLLFLEHPSVITLGRHGKARNILASEERLKREGIPVFRTERGGDVTYHGPGQIVCYPIFHLREDGLTVSQLVFKLEEVVIRTLTSLGIDGGRLPLCRGVFVGGEKICSLGLKIKSDVSMYGLALDVNTDLKYFDYIIPCALKDVRVTSIARLAGHEVAMAEVTKIMTAHFYEVFNFPFQLGSIKLPHLQS